MSNSKMSKPKPPAEPLPLRLEWRTPAELADNPSNWRTHPETQTEGLAAVIGQVGWAGAALYNETTGRLIDGHARKNLPAECLVDGKLPVLVGSWTEEQERMILLTLDPLAGLAEADNDALGRLLLETQSDDAAIQSLLAGLAEENGIDVFAEETLPDPEPEAQVDRAKELQAQWKTKAGQLWTVEGKAGVHRVLCGDSTKAEDVARLMDGAKAEMMFADPPYGVDYDGGHFHSGNVNIKRKREKLEGDSSTDIYAQFLPVAMGIVDGPCYLWFAGSLGRAVYDAVEDAGGVISTLLIWHKVNATYAAMNAQYKQRHEPCLYFKPKGSTLRWVGPSDACSLWEFNKEGINKLHPTQKPTELVCNAIKNHKATTIYDPFLGSGTTLVAAENLSRVCYGLEISPAYTGVILQRCKDAGLSPRLAGSDANV